MKFHVKFQGLFWFCEISYKHFGEYFGQKPEKAGSVRNTAPFAKNSISYPMHEEEMLKSKHYKDSF